MNDTVTQTQSKSSLPLHPCRHSESMLSAPALQPDSMFQLKITLASIYLSDLSESVTVLPSGGILVAFIFASSFREPRMNQCAFSL